MADDAVVQQVEHRKDQKRMDALLSQVQNAGFDLDTVEGRNAFRQALEFGDRNRRRCETASGELTKYGVLLVAMTVVALLAAGFWSEVKVVVGGDR